MIVANSKILNTSKTVILILFMISIITYTKCSDGKCSGGRRTSGSAAHHTAHHGGGCFKGTSLVKMYDGNLSKIQDIKKHDKIIGWDSNNIKKVQTVEDLIIHQGNYTLYSINIECKGNMINLQDFITDNHPVYQEKNEWCVINLDENLNNKYYNFYNLKECHINDKIYYLNEFCKLKNILENKVHEYVYDIELVGDYNSYIVNGLRVVD